MLSGDSTRRVGVFVDSSRTGAGRRPFLSALTSLVLSLAADCSRLCVVGRQLSLSQCRLSDISTVSQLPSSGTPVSSPIDHSTGRRLAQSAKLPSGYQQHNLGG